MRCTDHVQGQFARYIHHFRAENLGQSPPAFHSEVVTVGVDDRFPAKPFPEIQRYARRRWVSINIDVWGFRYTHLRSR